MHRPLSLLITELEQDRALREPHRLRERSDVLDRLESYRALGPSDAVAVSDSTALARRIVALSAALQAVDEQLFERIRQAIQRGEGGRSLREWVAADRSDQRAGEGLADDSYDYLDALVSGVLQIEAPEAPLTGLLPEMVSYQPTPARHIFELIARSALHEHDVLVDIGSGLGHVPLLAAICSGARCIGIEWDPAYVASARRCALALDLDRVTFAQGDARLADLSTGTVFYLYTPFGGSMLREMLDRLRIEAADREIRIGTLGPCTAVVARERWLQAVGPCHADRPVLFRCA